MIWQDKGYLVSKIKYAENTIISEFYTELHGKTSGLIFGATSKRIRNYLLIGNKFHLNYSAKSENKIGNFNIEIDEITTPKYLDNKQKLSCIIYSMNLIKILTVENQKNLEIYKLISNLFEILNSTEWIKEFIFWELQIFKNLGYELNLKNYVTIKKINGNETFLLKNNENKIIPKFLIDNKNQNVKHKDLLNSLNIVGDFLQKSILGPNNINFPDSRSDFLNSIN